MSIKKIIQSDLKCHVNSNEGPEISNLKTFKFFQHKIFSDKLYGYFKNVWYIRRLVIKLKCNKKILNGNRGFFFS